MSSIEATVQSLSDRIREHGKTISTEEAAKTAIVLPFLQALGYDVFNPSEVIPEFTADAVGKKGEKVDYAIKLDDEIRILVECKGLSTNLEAKHLSQLFRYFTVTNARFAILTNGRFFEFYSDLEEPNKLDKKPFLNIDLLDVSAAKFTELKKFERATFDVDKILATAERLKYVSLVKKSLNALFEAPSSDFIKMIASEVHEGRLNAQLRDTIEAAIKAAFKDLVRDQVQSRLSNALASNVDPQIEAPEDITSDDGIVTTEVEIEGMHVIRAIVRDIISVNRVIMRDSKSYCAILIDNNNRNPLARMHFNRKQLYIGLFDSGAEERIAIETVDDIYTYADRLRKTAAQYVVA